MKSLLGIDIGTTAAKCALFGIDGHLIDVEYKGYSITYPREGWAEQNPEDWWNALVDTVKKVISRNKSKTNVTAMSLSTQGGCLVLLDDYFQPVYNAVSWLDHRARENIDYIQREISPDILYKNCGWGNLDCLSFPTVLWFKKNNPELFKKVRYCASTIDYLNHRLTGKFSIDCSNLAMTLFLDLFKKDWSDEVLGIAGLTRNNVPEIIESGNIIGAIKQDAAEEMGLSKDVLLISGAHDQYCSSIGAGAVHNGDCILSTGTAWVLTVTSDKLLFDNNQSIHPCIHLVENKYGLLMSVPSGGNSLNWFQTTFQPGLTYEELSREAEKSETGSKGLIFIPRDTSKSGNSAFLNIDPVHTSSCFTRAVFEGVALANRKHMEIFFENDIKISKLIMIGGGAGSSVWPQIVADVSNVPVAIPNQKETACAGAAILAGMGSKLFSSIEEAGELFTGENKIIKPVEKNAEIYNKMYGDFINYLEYT